MLATSSVQTLRTAPTATVADRQDVLSDRARGYHDLTVRAQQLRYNAVINAPNGSTTVGVRFTLLTDAVGATTNYITPGPTDSRIPASFTSNAPSDMPRTGLYPLASVVVYHGGAGEPSGTSATFQSALATGAATGGGSPARMQQYFQANDVECACRGENASEPWLWKSEVEPSLSMVTSNIGGQFADFPVGMEFCGGYGIPDIGRHPIWTWARDGELVDVACTIADEEIGLKYATGKDGGRKQAEQGWTFATDIKARQWVAGPTRPLGTVAGIKHIEAPGTRVYNFGVDGTRTYFVSGTTVCGQPMPAWVHNTHRKTSKAPEGTKSVPNPHGSKGSPEHRAVVNRRIKELEGQGHTHTHGGNKKEEVIPTPGGAKSCRRPDITTTAPDGSVYRENVGRKNKDGTPVSRERKALDDLENRIGVRPGYAEYKKK